MRTIGLVSFAVICTVWSTVYGTASNGSKVDRVATLVARTCPEVTREALSGGEPQSRIPPGGTAAEVWIAAESYRDLRITLWQNNAGTVEAEVAQASASAGPVCEQLKRAYRSNLSLGTKAAANLIEVTVTGYAESSVPELPSLLNEVRHIVFQTLLSDSIFFPNRRIHIEVTNGVEAVSVEFNEPSPTAESVPASGGLVVSQPQALDWVHKLIHALDLEAARSAASKANNAQEP